MLRAFAENVWVAERSFRWAGVDLGNRVTIVKRPGGGLWVHSPVALDDALRREVDALGPVEHLFAPNRMHHLFLKQWVEAWPAAKLWGAAGLARKRADLRFDGEVAEEPPAAWGSGFKTTVLHGCVLREIAVLEEATRTLFLADHLFWFGPGQPFAIRLIGRLFGCYDRPGFFDAPIKGFVKDRAKLRPCIERVCTWDFDRIVLSHGNLVPSGGAAVLREAYAGFWRD